jgi:hypothetical protein
VAITNKENRSDLYKAVIALVVIIVCAILVYGDKLNIAVFAVIISGVTGYYFGKSSDKGSLLE